jgi:hypothetical protein
VPAPEPNAEAGNSGDDSEIESDSESDSEDDRALEQAELKEAAHVSQRAERTANNDTCAPWKATVKNLAAMDRAYGGVLGPPGFTRGNARPISSPAKFKTHTWIVYFECMLPWLFTFLHLPVAQYDAAVSLSTAVRLLNQRTLTPIARATIVADVTRLVRSACDALPPVAKAVLMHKMIEMAIEIQRWGVTWARSMFQIERWLGFFGRLCTNRNEVEASMHTLYDTLMFSYVAAPAADEADQALAGSEDDDDDEANDAYERDLLVSKILTVSLPGHGRNHDGVSVANNGTDKRMEIRTRDTTRVRQLVNSVLPGGDANVDRPWMFLGSITKPNAVTVDGTKRTQFSAVQAHLAQRARTSTTKKLYTTAFSEIPLSKLSRSTRILLGTHPDSEADGQMTCVIAVQQFWRSDILLSYSISDSLLARVLVLPAENDPEFDMATLSFDDSIADWVFAADLGPVVALGPGNGGFGDGGKGRWTVLHLPGNYAKS